MATMTAGTIVSNAIYLSVQDAEHQPVLNGGYVEFGLATLNYILDEWRDWIPFQQEFTFDNVDQLTSTAFLSVSNVNFVLNNVQMPLLEVSLTRFNEFQQVLGLTGLPAIYYWDELAQTINVYPSPSNPVYSFTVWGRTAQQPLTFSSPLPANMPLFMQDGVTYEVAFRLCGRYGVPWSDNKEQTRQKLLDYLKGKKIIDLAAPRQAVFGRPDSGGIPPFPYWYYLSGGH